MSPRYPSAARAATPARNPPRRPAKRRGRGRPGRDPAAANTRIKTPAHRPLRGPPKGPELTPGGLPLDISGVCVLVSRGDTGRVGAEGDVPGRGSGLLGSEQLTVFGTHVVDDQERKQRGATVLRGPCASAPHRWSDPCRR